MNKLNTFSRLVSKQFRLYKHQLPLRSNPLNTQNLFKPFCQFQFSKYNFGSKQITQDRHSFNAQYQAEREQPPTKYLYFIAGIGIAFGGYSAMRWIIEKNEELNIQEAQVEERVAVEKAIDNDDYVREINLLEKNVMENNSFTLEYAFILHFSYVKLQMFEKADALEKRMMQFYPKQTLIIHRYMACHYLAMENYVIALKHLIFAAKNYPKVSQEDKIQVETEIEPYIKELDQLEQQQDLIKADLLGFLGQIYNYMHLYKESEYFFRQSLKLKPNELINQFQLAVVLLHQQLFDESESLLQNIIRQPNIDTNLKLLATEELSIIYLCEDDQEKALHACQKLNPDYEKQCLELIERTKIKQKKRFGKK